MALESDIVIVENGDVDIQNGDFNIQSANSQNISFVCFAEKGNNKEYPDRGVGLLKMRNIPKIDFRFIASKIKEELIKDGYKTVNIYSQTDNIEINADRN